VKIKRKKPRVTPQAAPVSPQAQAPSRQYKSVENVLSPDMIAYHYWREWFRARDRNDWAFMYHMSREDSPLRAQLGEEDSFAERCRRRDRAVPGLRPGDLQKIRLDGPDVAQVLRIVGLEDRTKKDVTVERWCMLRHEEGWSMHAVDEITRAREEVVESLDVAWFEPFVPPTDFVGRSEALAARESSPASAII